MFRLSRIESGDIVLLIFAYAPAGFSNCFGQMMRLVKSPGLYRLKPRHQLPPLLFPTQ